MDERETLARVLLRIEVDVHSEDPWEETGEELHTAYLHDADAIIALRETRLWGWLLERYDKGGGPVRDGKLNSWPG